jgi:hypothetical protein
MLHHAQSDPADDNRDPEDILPQLVDMETLAGDMEALAHALEGHRGKDQAAIAREVVRWGALILRKNRDYGGVVWERPILAPDCAPGVAIRVRMSDKISRLVSLLQRPAEVTDESIDDTLRDLGAYCLLELARPGRHSASGSKPS